MCHKWMLKFLFKKLIYVNWRIITLQQCDGFFATHQYEPAIGTHISPPSCTPLTFYPPPSLQVSTEPPLWVPWVIHQTCMVFICCTYGNVYVSVLFSQVIPPSPFPNGYLLAVSSWLKFLSEAGLPLPTRLCAAIQTNYEAKSSSKHVGLLQSLIMSLQHSFHACLFTMMCTRSYFSLTTTYEGAVMVCLPIL